MGLVGKAAPQCNLTEPHVAFYHELRGSFDPSVYDVRVRGKAESPFEYTREVRGGTVYDRAHIANFNGFVQVLLDVFSDPARLPGSQDTGVLCGTPVARGAAPGVHC